VLPALALGSSHAGRGLLDVCEQAMDLLPQRRGALAVAFEVPERSLGVVSSVLEAAGAV